MKNLQLQQSTVLEKVEQSKVGRNMSTKFPLVSQQTCGIFTKRPSAQNTVRYRQHQGKQKCFPIIWMPSNVSQCDGRVSVTLSTIFTPSSKWNSAFIF
ncbi:hypothetical protein AVEN_174899-1 [Araneus ventricosus]|uniref:Uncharacterized protein n=1 Tax=Araneus ventricosus TaxID=182803 RepID=A0A4Y2J1R9_ARAVE|nr:hypothetical protein AVEN_174899-1 [Araneus ventricosus]